MFKWLEPYEGRFFLYKKGYNRSNLSARIGIFLAFFVGILFIIKFILADSGQKIDPFLFSIFAGIIIVVFYPILRGIFPNKITINENGIFFRAGNLLGGRYNFDSIDRFVIDCYKNNITYLELKFKRKKIVRFAIAKEVPIANLSAFLKEHIVSKKQNGLSTRQNIDKPISNASIETEGIDISSEETGIKSYDLAKNKACVLILILSGAAFFYAIMDIFLNFEYYTEGRYYSIYLQSAIFSFLFAFIIVKLQKIPIVETIVISVLFGITIGIAAYPGMLRINQITDADGLIEYTYYPSEEGILYPEEKGLPELKFKNECGYWDQFDYDSPYPIPVRLRKGKLNFYQVDFKPIYEDMNKWNPGGHIDCKSKAKKAKLKNND